MPQKTVLVSCRHKMQKMQITFFLQNHKKTEMEAFAFHVITFEPLNIQTHQVPQNDHLNFSFVPVDLMVGKKMAKNGKKISKKISKKNRNFFFFFNFLKSFFACIFANNDFSLRFAKVRPCFSKKIFIFYHWILSFNLAIPCRNEQMNKVPPKMQFTVLKWG